MSNLEKYRNEFHKTMQIREEAKQKLKESTLFSISALHEKNNERIHHIITILQDEAKYLWDYCSNKYKCYDHMSTDTYVGTIIHNILISFGGIYENAILEFNIINNVTEDKFVVHSAHIVHEENVYEFYERTFNPTVNILDYADSIKTQSMHIDWLEHGVEDMFKCFTCVEKKYIEYLEAKTKI